MCIIFVVLVHAGPPQCMFHFFHLFNMPVFFIASGYFFKYESLYDPLKFCKKKIERLYLPFLKWALLFLLLHNLWFEIGILNQEYGSIYGHMPHPYDLREFRMLFFHIVVGMTGYDEFMAAPFWFFRGLLVASLLFFVVLKTLDSLLRIKEVWCIIVACVICYIFQTVRLWQGFEVVFIPNGGLREVWGAFFIGIGALCRKFECKLKCRWCVTMICFVILCIGSQLSWHGMENTGSLRDVVTLPLTGFAGFVFVRHLSQLVTRAGGGIERLLTYIGDNTFYIFILHVVCFKIASALKILYYNLDWGHIGSHLVVHYKEGEDCFWILYTVIGTSVPLIMHELWKRWFAPLSARIYAFRRAA